MLSATAVQGEHAALEPGLRRLQKLARATPGAPLEIIRPDLARAVAFLEQRLLPYAAAEEEVIYPMLRVLPVRARPALESLSASRSTSLRRLVHELADLQAGLQIEIDERVRTRIALLLDSAVRTMHARMRCEEEVIWPLLASSLDDSDLAALLGQLERSVAWHRAGAA